MTVRVLPLVIFYLFWLQSTPCKAEITADSIISTAFAAGIARAAWYLGGSVSDSINQYRSQPDAGNRFLYLQTVDSLESSIQLSAAEETVAPDLLQSEGVEVFSHGISGGHSIIQASVSNYAVLTLMVGEQAQGIFFLDKNLIRIIDQRIPEQILSPERVSLAVSSNIGRKSQGGGAGWRDSHDAIGKVIRIEDIHKRRFIFRVDKDKNGYLVIVIYDPVRGNLPKSVSIATNIHEFQPEGQRLLEVMQQFQNVVISRKILKYRSRINDFDSVEFLDKYHFLKLWLRGATSHLEIIEPEIQVQKTVLSCFRSGDVLKVRGGLFYCEIPGIYQGMSGRGGGGGGHGQGSSASGYGSAGKSSGKARDRASSSIKPSKAPWQEDHFAQVTEASRSVPAEAVKVPDRQKRRGQCSSKSYGKKPGTKKQPQQSGQAVYRQSDKPVCTVKPRPVAAVPPSVREHRKVEQELITAVSLSERVGGLSIGKPHSIVPDSNSSGVRRGACFPIPQVQSSELKEGETESWTETQDFWGPDDDIDLDKSGSDEFDYDKTNYASPKIETPRSSARPDAISTLSMGGRADSFSNQDQCSVCQEETLPTKDRSGEPSKIALENKKKRARRRARKLDDASFKLLQISSSSDEERALRIIRKESIVDSGFVQNLINYKISQEAIFEEIEGMFMSMFETAEIDAGKLAVLLSVLEGMMSSREGANKSCVRSASH